MATTTSYGTWGNYAGSASISDTVSDFVNGGGDEWNDRLVQTGAFGQIVDDFRVAINAELPGGITLHGNDFYGPYPLEGGVRPADLNEMIPNIINRVDLGEIVARHDPDDEG